MDDLEASYRTKGKAHYKGYVANLTETCDPANELQLITKVQVASNNVDDSQLLVEALPNLKARTDLETMVTDGGYGGEASDRALQTAQVNLIQTAIRGRNPSADKLHLSDFSIKFNQEGKPSKVTCPQGQTVPVQTSAHQKAYVVHFDSAICQTCPFFERCPAQPGRRDQRHHLHFTQAGAHAAERRRLSEVHEREGRKLRPAVEASVRSIKHPFPAGKLPVRGRFRMACMMIGSAAMTNVRRIQRFTTSKMRTLRDSMNNNDHPQTCQDSFFCHTQTLLGRLAILTKSL